MNHSDLWYTFKSDAFVFDLKMSEGESRTLTCDTGTFTVVSASYYSPNDTSCLALDVKTFLQAICDKKSSCKITASNDAFDKDPCHGQKKKLSYKLNCGSAK